jgi:flavin-dependent dehydrogenase
VVRDEAQEGVDDRSHEANWLWLALILLSPSAFCKEGRRRESVHFDATMDAERQPAASAPAHDPGGAARYDVVVIGGAFAGAATALQLRRRAPGCRVLVVERQERFGRKVGEATVEISGMFLSRILGLHDYLAREQLPKHGLRFWFSDRADRRLEEISEVGPVKLPALPSFQLDRAKLDEHLLATAAAEGAEVLRPAKVVSVELGWPESRLELETAGAGPMERREVRARWVVDASGRQTFLARRLGLVERMDSHPTAAAWARWRGVADLDGPGVLGRDPLDPRLPPVAAARRLATNHFCGYGFWCWAIPLAGGDTSVGVVYDKRLFSWPTEGKLREQFRHFVTRGIPGLGELLAGATMDEDDFLAYAHLPYRSRRYMGRGWALVGDAASFMDPYYSPGLDHAGMSTMATVEVLRRDLAGELGEGGLDAAIAVHDGEFGRSYTRWLEAIYVDKYELMGDAELTAAAFLFDTGMYYLGIVGPRVADPALVRHPAFGEDIRATAIAHRVMVAFKRRLVYLARFRRATGTYGRRNAGWRLYPSRFEVERRRAMELVAGGLRLWWGAEWDHWKHRLRHGRPALEVPPAWRQREAPGEGGAEGVRAVPEPAAP